MKSNIDVFSQLRCSFLILPRRNDGHDVLCASRWGHDAKRRVVAVAIRRARRVRRGYKKSSEAAKTLGITIYCS